MIPAILPGILPAIPALLFTVLRWSEAVGVDLGKWPVLAAYRSRIGQRPAVQEALKAEGLTK